MNIKYEQMRDKGASPEQVWQTAESDGLDWAARIRLIRSLFGLSLVDAKEVMVRADGLADSLNEYQAGLVDILEEYFNLPEEE